MIVLDTDHLSILLDERDARHAPLRDRLRAAGDVLAIPIIGIEEQLRGWLAKLRGVNDPHKQIAPYLRLSKVFRFLREWPIVEWDERAAEEFARLRSLRLRIGTQDLKIACITLANDPFLLTANLRDFEHVPGLRVEDWLK
jgi:tRNA(fMet)-specific endonuclease VapC